MAEGHTILGERPEGEPGREAEGFSRRTFPVSVATGLVHRGVLTIRYCEGRPDEGWHAHGTTSKRIWLLVGWKPVPVKLVKQRWLNADTRETRHDRPVWDRPGGLYAMDVVVAVLTVWLNAGVPLRQLHWGWDDLRPDPRTATRWTALLRPHGDAWLRQARAYLVDLVNPRALDEVLPAGGIPPPRRLRCHSQDGVDIAGKLNDVVWLHEKVARALSISLRTLLEGARWRWPVSPRQSPTF